MSKTAATKNSQKENSKFSNVVYLISVLDILGASIVVPLLPHQARSLGATAYYTGMISSVYGALQLIGSPIMGRLSDLWGRKFILIVSLLSAAVSYSLQANATSLTFLALSRIPVGILKQSMSVTQAVITDKTSSQQRLNAIARNNASIALGFIIGPSLGGQLSRYGYAVPMYLSAAIFVLNSLLVYFIFPETNKAKEEDGVALNSASNNNSNENNNKDSSNNNDDNDKSEPHHHQHQHGSSSSSSRKGGITQVSGRSRMLLLLRLLTSLSNQLFRSSFSMITLSFGLTPEQSGYVLSYLGLIGFLVQQFAVPLLGRKHSDTSIIKAGVAISVAFQVIIGLSADMHVFLLCLIPVSFATNITRTASISMVTKSSDQSIVGFVLGLSGTVDSMSRMLSPSLGGVLLANFGPPSVFFCAAAMILPVPLVLKYLGGSPMQMTSAKLE